MNEYGQIGRIFQIFLKLIQCKSMTIKSIHDSLKNDGFDVSRRTIERDIRKMFIESFPINCMDEEEDSKRNREYYIDREYLNWVLQKVPLHEHLAEKIMEKLLPPSQEVGYAIGRRDNSLGKGDFDEPGYIWFDAKFIGFFDYSKHREILTRLIDSLLRKVVCQVEYQALASETAKTYTIEPYRLVFYRGGLYVMAIVRKHRKIVSLAIERIKSLRFTDKRFKDSHKKAVQEFKKDQFGMFEAYPVQEVELRFEKAVVPHIQGRIWHESQKEKLQKDGSLLLNFTVGLSDELISWILSWGRWVKVIKPEELKQKIKEEARCIDNNYTSGKTHV